MISTCDYLLTGETKSFNASDVHSRTMDQGGADHVLAEFGAPVPVLVTETLTMAERAFMFCDCNVEGVDA